MIEILKVAVPLFAGLIGGAALAWKIYVWRHERRPHLSVSATNLLPVFFGSGPGDWCFGIEALNEDVTPVEVRSVGFDMNDGTDRKIFQTMTPPGATLPGVVNGRTKATTWMTLDELERAGLDTHGSIVAWVRTAADEEIRSQPTILRTP